MKALLCKTIGGPDDLVVEEVSAPSLGPDEVRIEVHACGINHLDCQLRAGELDTEHDIRLPCVPGPAAEGHRRVSLRDEEGLLTY